MIVIGLTGSIASGKSTVLRMFAEEGIPTLSADQIVHALYESESVPAFEVAFPGSVREGKVDRDALMRIMIAEPDSTKKIEALIHPAVRRRMLAFAESRRARAERMVVLEIPLLFELGESYPIDKVVVTWADPDELRGRALSRAGMSPTRYKYLLERQLSQDEKRARADFTIDTGQPPDAVRNEVRAIIAACLDTPVR
ncbi:MAG: dephospho-CoA kinase [Cucumibacter sp.]